MDAIRVTKVERVQLDLFVPPSLTPANGSKGDSGGAAVSKQRLSITLHLTPHHLVLVPDTTSDDEGAVTHSQSRSSLDPTKMTDEIWIPYPSITLLTRLPQTLKGLYPLQIRTRNFESYILGFERDREGGAEDVWQSVKDCAVSASVEQLYAFNYALPAGSVASSSKQTLSPSSTRQTSTSRSDTSPLSSSPPRDEPSPAVPPKHAQGASLASGWQVYNPRTEFARQGVGSRTRAWRFTDINKDYSFSPTYPSKMVVPSRIGDAVLQYAGKYRSKARIPALTYLHWANNASITRSSQPMVGLKGARSAQDEKLVECIFSSHNSPEDAYTSSSSSSSTPAASAAPQALPHVYGATATNLIIDARPTTNAMANVAMGAGTENMEHYKFGKKAYLGIDNIHVMRKSLHTIIEALTDAEGTGNIIDRTLLRKSNWLRHISTILDGALVIIRNIHLNASHVLIHCSDGWDRTAQLSALAQVCLDPYYRTIDGFRVLIEKDWVSFGHKFLDRSGHLSSEKHFTVVEPEDDSDDELGGGAGAQKAAQAFFASVQKQFASSGNSHQKEVSPVFHQFLDCIRQVQRQFPERFEYNEQFLLDLHYHLYSCQFGTFLFNSERERRVPPSLTYKAYCERTVSIWDWVDLDRSPYLNDTFDPALDDRQSRDEHADQGVLMLDPKDVKFWHGLFRRGDEEMNGSKLALAQAQGAEVLTVSPGQPDPGTPDALTSTTIDNPLAAATASTLQPPHSIQDGPPSRSRTPTAPTPPPKSARVPTTTTAGWNWSQFSSGAFNALSVAGSQIKTISSEAMNQIRAEAHEGRELGGLARNNYPSTSAAPRAVRLPSEANPWSTEDDDNKAYSPATAPPPPPAKPAPAQQAQTQARSNRAWNHDPWVNAPTAPASAEVDDRPSLDRLTLHEDPPRSRGPSPRPAAAPPAPPPKQSAKDRELEEAALGGDQKAWDPLGAL